MKNSDQKWQQRLAGIDTAVLSQLIDNFYINSLLQCRKSRCLYGDTLVGIQSVYVTQML